MKINPNYTIRFKGTENKDKVQTENSGSNATVKELGPVTPDYGVSVPINYAKTEEIKLPNNLTAYCYKLANGQKVVIVPKEGTTVVKTYVNTGSLNEPDNVRGISHYIEHNLFNGSESLGDKVFFDEVHNIGAYTNASTSFSVTDYYISSNLLDDTDLETKIKLQAGMLQTPKFLQEKLEKEKKIVNSEINMCLSDDLSRAETVTLKNLFNIKSTSPDLVAGSTNNIDALTRKDVVNYFNNNYYPANMVTVITGEIDPENTVKLVSKYFNSTKSPKTQRHFEKMTPIDKSVRTDLISSKTQGSAGIFLGFAGPENSNAKDRIYLDAVSQLLFDLANAKIKTIEEKYSTFVSYDYERLGSRPSDRNAEIIKASVPEEYVEPLLKDLYKVISDLKPTSEEFEAIKNKLKKNNSTSIESSEILNQKLGTDFINGSPYKLSEYNSIVDNMTYEDFVNTVKKYFDLNKVSLTVVHPEGTTVKNIESNYRKTLSFTGTVKKVPFKPEKISEYTLSNNYGIIFDDENNDTINYSIVLKTNKNITQKPAVSDVLFDMLQNCGTKNKTKEEESMLLDRHAIDVGISSDTQTLSLFGNSSSNNTKLALELFKNKILNPDLTQEVFDKAIQHCKDSYMTVEPNAYENYRKIMLKNTGIDYTTEEKLKSLEGITLEDVKALYEEILANSQAQVVVTGKVSDELKQQVFSSFNSYPEAKVKDVKLLNNFEKINSSKVYTVETKRNQAEILQGYKFNINGNMKDNLCLLLLSDILGGSPSSRLFSDLREKRHLAYSVHSNYESVDDIGIMTLSIETTTNNHETGVNTFDNIQKSIEGFNENIKEILNQKVSDEELATAKKSLKTKILSSLEMNSGKTLRLTKSANTPYGISYVNKQFEMIDNITSEDILNTAKNVFKNNPVYSISATKEALEGNKDYFNSLSA